MKKRPLPIGQKIGTCVLVAEVDCPSHVKNKSVRYAKFKCGFCGDMFITSVASVKIGSTRSCGCLYKKSNKTHGMSNSHCASVWGNMKTRCYSKNHNSYRNYGGRGIGVCKSWRESFVSFYEYVSKLDNYGRYKYTLDRIDNDGNYEPGNVRWVSYREQSKTRRSKGESGYKGVIRVSKNSYSARITVKGKGVYLGTAPSAKEAALLRDEYIIKNGLSQYYEIQVKQI